jgi:hypothetical protein
MTLAASRCRVRYALPLATSMAGSPAGQSSRGHCDNVELTTYRHVRFAVLPMKRLSALYRAWLSQPSTVQLAGLPKEHLLKNIRMYRLQEKPCARLFGVGPDHWIIETGHHDHGHRWTQVARQVDKLETIERPDAHVDQKASASMPAISSARAASNLSKDTTLRPQPATSGTIARSRSTSSSTIMIRSSGSRCEWAVDFFLDNS